VSGAPDPKNPAFHSGVAKSALIDRPPLPCGRSKFGAGRQRNRVWTSDL
jgi:hypothetical protein